MVRDRLDKDLRVGWWPSEDCRVSSIPPDWLTQDGHKNIRIIGWDKSEHANGKFDWLVVDSLAGVSRILEQFERLKGLLLPDGRLWILIAPQHEAMRGGRERWEWLIQLTNRMGWFCLAQKKYVGNLSYLEFMYRDAWPALRWNLLGNQPEYTQQCRDLFKRAFNQDITLDLWKWKYGEGRGFSTIALRDGKVIAHYGCSSRNIVFNGQIVKALQICDVMVDPKERAVMTKHGAFFNVASAAQEAFIGYGGIHELGYGFPNQRHMKLAAKIGLYDEVEHLIEMEWVISKVQRETWASRSEWHGVEYLEKIDVDSLWKKMQAQMQSHILVMRDLDYVRYRYITNPQHKYIVVVVRRCMTGRLMGLAILRPEGEECRLMDVVGEPGHFRTLLRHARQVASSINSRVFKLWITENSRHWFVDDHERCITTDIVIPLNRHVRIRAVDEVINRWFLTMGDTDFL